MDKEKNKISREDILRQVLKATRRTALIYHHFSQTLIRELGEKKGKELIQKAIQDYGIQIGREAAQKVQKKNLPLTPKNFPSDLPDDAWDTETVFVDGEERVRVFRCPLAAEWMEWGDPQTARLYCAVDQAKMWGYNPEYAYIHIKNLLDGDPYCELAIKPVPKDAEADDNISNTDGDFTSVQWAFGKYSREDYRPHGR